jgi:hypothetical protein
MLEVRRNILRRHPRMSAFALTREVRAAFGEPRRMAACGALYLIGGAYWMPPALQSWLSPRGIFSLDSEPTLRS